MATLSTPPVVKVVMEIERGGSGSREEITNQAKVTAGAQRLWRWCKVSWLSLWPLLRRRRRRGVWW